MRRTKNLYERIVERENILLAFSKAAKGRRSQAVVREYAINIETNIERMSDLLLAGTFPVGRNQQFLIRDPKERVITAPCFDERVMHHAIMNVCEPVMDRWLIFDTYACRQAKGREAAVRRAARFTRTNPWYVKLDVRKYFDSIPHGRLLNALEKRIGDRRLMALLTRIVEAFRGEQAKVLPIGSLSSQHFANFFLDPLDRFIKEERVVRGYIRYMDDMVLWHHDRQELFRVREACRDLSQDRLGLDLKVSEVRRCEKGIPLLGCQVFPTHIELSRRSRRRWGRSVKYIQKAETLGAIDQYEAQRRLAALVAFARAADARSWQFRNATLQRSFGEWSQEARTG
ncbi:reverse transcriptase domain-containing protein [Planctomycetaceae bacterium SH139]